MSHPVCVLSVSYGNDCSQVAKRALVVLLLLSLLRLLPCTDFRCWSSVGP